MTTKKLHELPEDHPLRNTALKDLDVRLHCRREKKKSDPRTWKIRNDTYNRLGETWKTNFDFVVSVEE
jgi:hypothetical protein